MLELTNFHTHTAYCDGAASVAEMAEAALTQGFAALGFSGHSDTPFDRSYCMDPAACECYRADVQRAKERYAGRLEIYCGLELDLFSPMDAECFDYIIGSVHYLRLGQAYYSVDSSLEQTKALVENHFQGDYYAFAEAYFAQAGQVAAATNCDIIGHFDLCSKYNEGNRLFDQENSRYREAALAALRQAAQAGKPFEINTGAMYRGLRQGPYPAPFLLRELQRLGGSVIFSSDSHGPASLSYGFRQALDLARDCGFTAIRRFNGQGFSSLPL